MVGDAGTVPGFVHQVVALPGGVGGGGGGGVAVPAFVPKDAAFP